MRARPSKRSAGNAIPSKQRAAIDVRDNRQCQRCGLAGTEKHHRRSRRARDEHTHCMCNLITLCHDCHALLTKEVEQARAEGMAVSMHDPNPGATAVHTFGGWVSLSCDGGVNLV